MNQKKDLQHLHVRIKPITAEKLKAWSEELGWSIGEMIDHITEGYENYCNKEDDVLEKTEIHETLRRLVEKVDIIYDKIK